MNKNEVRDDYLVKAYAVYDAKGEHFGEKPMFFNERADAVRSFESAVNDSQSMIANYPEDFTLIEIGTWDKRRGVLLMYDAKVSLGVGSQFKKQPVVA